MSIPKEAVEAACDEWSGNEPWGIWQFSVMERAITAALPHLAHPSAATVRDRCKAIADEFCAGGMSWVASQIRDRIAALPHLAQPSQSDEDEFRELAGAVWQKCHDAIDGGEEIRVIASALVAVRAEARAAEREAIAKWADTWVNAPVNIADTIRSRPTP